MGAHTTFGILCSTSSHSTVVFSCNEISLSSPVVKCYVTHQTPLDRVGDRHNLGLREAVLLGGLLTHVLQQRHHGVEGGAVDELGVSLALLPLGLHPVSLLGLLHRLQAALLDSGVLGQVL